MIPPELLASLPLIVDGRPGDWLRRQQPALAEPIEALNLRRPDWVREAHQAYFAAGSRVLRTNTHAASALALGAHGLEDRCEAVNNSGAACLREAIGDKAVMVGAIGQIGTTRGPHPPEADRTRGYGQLAVYLSDLGCDAILLDGFDAVAECLRVLRVVRDAGDAPVLAALRLDSTGCAADGTPAARAAAALAEAGVDALGWICGPEATGLAEPVADARASGLPVAIFLDAVADLSAGSTSAHDLSPEAFAERLVPLAGLGAALLGGGRGCWPQHIAALASRLKRG
jgi:homocysteine S-methyltransferase